MLISLRDLSKSFGPAKALDGISAQIEGPALIGIVGDEGAGATTLLRIMHGSTRADGGRVVVNGQTVIDPSGEISRAWLRKCAITFPRTALASHQTALENLLEGAAGRALRLKSMWESRETRLRHEARAVLDMLDCRDLANTAARHLTPGQRNLVAIGRSLMGHPRVLSVDDPVAKLNAVEAAQVMKALRHIQLERSLTVICTFQSADLAKAHCDRLIQLHAGRLDAGMEHVSHTALQAFAV